jgi:hypothetical protein
VGYCLLKWSPLSLYLSSLLIPNSASSSLTHHDHHLSLSQVVGAHGAVGRFPRLPDRGLSVYESVSDAFEWLPLGAVVQGTVLVLHGGIGSQGRRATVSQRHSFNQAAAPEPGPR